MAHNRASDHYGTRSKRLRVANPHALPDPAIGDIRSPVENAMVQAERSFELVKGIFADPATEYMRYCRSLSGAFKRVCIAKRGLIADRSITRAEEHRHLARLETIRLALIKLGNDYDLEPEDTMFTLNARR